MARLPLPTLVFTVWTLVLKFNPPLSSLFMFLYFPQFSPMTSHALQSKKSRKRQARTRMLVVCLQYCVERWAERLKDTHSVLAWRRHKSPIVDLSLCVFVRVCMSRIGFLCLNYICGEKKWKCAEASSLTLCVYLCLIYCMGVFNRCVCGFYRAHCCVCVCVCEFHLASGRARLSSWRVWRSYMPAVWGAWLHCN